jgi:predicted DNA-binding protein
MTNLKDLITSKLINSKSLNIPIPIRLSSEMNERISSQSSILSTNRTALLRTLIEVGLEILENCKSSA